MSLQNVVDQEESESSVQTEGAESADLTECKETSTPHVLTYHIFTPCLVYLCLRLRRPRCRRSVSRWSVCAISQKCIEGISLDLAQIAMTGR